MNASQLRPHEVLFFDDDPWNVDGCVESGYAKCVHTPHGFHRGVWADAITSLL